MNRCEVCQHRRTEPETGRTYCGKDALPDSGAEGVSLHEGRAHYTNEALSKYWASRGRWCDYWAQYYRDWGVRIAPLVISAAALAISFSTYIHKAAPVEKPQPVSCKCDCVWQPSAQSPPGRSASASSTPPPIAVSAASSASGSRIPRERLGGPTQH